MSCDVSPVAMFLGVCPKLWEGQTKSNLWPIWISTSFFLVFMVDYPLVEDGSGDGGVV